MKTLSISFLALIAFPVHLMGQGTSSENTSYFANRQAEIQSEANHILSSNRRSNRKGVPAVAEIEQQPGTRVDVRMTAPVVEDSFPVPTNRIEFARPQRDPSTESINMPSQVVLAANEEVEFSMPQQPLHRQMTSGGDFVPSQPAERVALAPFTPLKVNEFKPLRIPPKVEPVTLERPWQEIEVVTPPVVVGEQGIVRPTPENTTPSDVVPSPTRSKYVVEDETLPVVEPIEPQVDRTLLQQNGDLAAKESTSLDHLRTSQRANSWDRQPGRMRHVTDHFSQGGEPFAYSTGGGNPNFFGVDRRSVCDEWAGICNCGGGLKDNPGHLGLPWLRSKDACDRATPLWPRKSRVKPACDSGCECQTCGD